MSDKLNMLTGHASFLCSAQKTFTPMSPHFHNPKKKHTHTHTTSLVVAWLQHSETKNPTFFPHLNHIMLQ